MKYVDFAVDFRLQANAFVDYCAEEISICYLMHSTEAFMFRVAKSAEWVRQVEF